MAEKVAFKNGRISNFPWIESYCIPLCITHRPLPICKISLKSKTFCGRMDVRTDIETGFIRSTLWKSWPNNNLRFRQLHCFENVCWPTVTSSSTTACSVSNAPLLLHIQQVSKVLLSACLSVCLSVWCVLEYLTNSLSKWQHSFGTRYLWSWLRIHLMTMCNTSCTSVVVDDIMCSHYEAKGHKFSTVMFHRECQMAAPVGRQKTLSGWVCQMAAPGMKWLSTMQAGIHDALLLG